VRREGEQGLSVTRRGRISRRDFLTGALSGRKGAAEDPHARRPPHDPGRDFDRYPLGRNEEVATRGGLAAPERTPETPETPEWERNLADAIEQLNDLTGIEEPQNGCMHIEEGDRHATQDAT
jgi:hypothetical protein